MNPSRHPGRTSDTADDVATIASKRNQNTCFAECFHVTCDSSILAKARSFQSLLGLLHLEQLITERQQLIVLLRLLRQGVLQALR